MSNREFIIKKPGKIFITVDNSSITISRKGMLNTINHGLKGDKTIPIKNITAIQIKKPGMTNGYIQFTILGGNESKAGIFNATQDENTIMFSKKEYKDMLELKELIEYKQHVSENKAVYVNNSAPTAAEQIKEFKELLDEGIITQQEFDDKKKQILNI